MDDSGFVKTIRSRLGQLEEFLVEKLGALYIHKEADLQVWTYFWFVQEWASRINKEYFVFNQVTLPGDRRVPDIVVFHHKTPIIALEMKNALLPHVSPQDLLEDTAKCIDYVQSRYLIAVQLVIHEFSKKESERVLSEIASMIHESGTGSSIEVVWINARDFKDYREWKQRSAKVGRVFKHFLST